MENKVLESIKKDMEEKHVTKSNFSQYLDEKIDNPSISQIIELYLSFIDDLMPFVIKQHFIDINKLNVDNYDVYDNIIGHLNVNNTPFGEDISNDGVVNHIIVVMNNFTNFIAKSIREPEKSVMVSALECYNIMLDYVLQSRLHSSIVEVRLYRDFTGYHNDGSRYVNHKVKCEIMIDRFSKFIKSI